MPAHKFTQASVGRLPLPSKRPQALYWDADLTGFGVLVSRTGTRTYIIQRQNKRRKLDRTDLLSLAEARQRAREQLADLGRGVDPLAVRKHQADAERRAKQKGTTLREALTSYLNARKTLRPATRHDYENVLERYCRDWLDAPLADLTPEHVAKRHIRICEDVSRGKTRGKQRDGAPRTKNRLATGHSAANGTMRILRAVWNHARMAKLVEGENPVAALSQTRAWFKERRRDTIIPAESLPGFVEAVKALQSDVSRDLILLMLYTGLRVTEACTLRWVDVDLNAKVLRIPEERTKAGRPLDLPLSGPVVKLLGARPRVGPWVFPGRAGHMEEPKAALDQVEKATKLHITSHDLRRTFITVANACRLTPYEIKGLVNHSLGNTDVTAGYIVTDAEWLRVPMQAVTDKLTALITPKPAKRRVKARVR